MSRSVSFWAYSLAYVGYQNLLYYYNVMASLGDYFSYIFSGNGSDSSLPLEVRTLKVDKLSCDPNKAWQKRRRSQVNRKVECSNPDTPIPEDKIRFVCISDTHTHLEKRKRLKIPDGDVLLHAGDFTVYGTADEIHLVNEYLGKTVFVYFSLLTGKENFLLSNFFFYYFSFMKDF